MCRKYSYRWGFCACSSPVTLLFQSPSRNRRKNSPNRGMYGVVRYLTPLCFKAKRAYKPKERASVSGLLQGSGGYEMRGARRPCPRMTCIHMAATAHWEHEAWLSSPPS